MRHRANVAAAVNALDMRSEVGRHPNTKAPLPAVVTEFKFDLRDLDQRALQKGELYVEMRSGTRRFRAQLQPLRAKIPATPRVSWSFEHVPKLPPASRRARLQLCRERPGNPTGNP